MMKILIKVAAAALVAMFGAAHAVPLTVDGPEGQFGFGGVGSAWSETFEFTLTETAFLQVTDLFLAGDVFEVFVNDVSAGLTSTPIAPDFESVGDFEEAFLDPRFSSAEFALDAGAYVISGLVAEAPFDSGTAAIRLSSSSLVAGEVPVPAAALLFAPAAFLLRRRRQAA